MDASSSGDKTQITNLNGVFMETLVPTMTLSVLYPISRMKGRGMRRLSNHPLLQRPLQRLDKFGGFVRLLQKAGQTFAGEAPSHLLLAIPTGENDGDSGPDAPQLGRGFLSIHHRHGQIEHDGNHFPGMPPENP